MVRNKVFLSQPFYFNSYLFQAWLGCDNEPILPLVCWCPVEGGRAWPGVLYDQAMAELGAEEEYEQEQGGHSMIYKETWSLKWAFLRWNNS